MSKKGSSTLKTPAFSLWLVTLALVALFLIAPKIKAAEPLAVYAVNYPLQYFAERIGGEHVNVILPMPRDIDPAYWEPDLQTISKYQQADMIVLNGAGYAKWTTKVSLPRSKIVDTSRKFKNQYIPLKDALTHSHGAGGARAHEGYAFTTWLDLDLAAQQAEAIYIGLSRKKPEVENYFKQNFLSLRNDLESLDQKIKAVAAKISSKPLLASHPVYDYLARRYGLNLVSMHWEPDQMPDSADWRALEELLQQHAAQWMLWEGEPETEIVEKLSSTGVGSLVFQPCANISADGDFLRVMEKNITELERAYEQNKG